MWLDVYGGGVVEFCLCIGIEFFDCFWCVVVVEIGEVEVGECFGGDSFEVG